ncbi:unnamed protein product [Tuwongella immobilis]|uniref:Uncharacterized protein n=2 Tax=Tuwongella immobilis TaxID=692036 RepID=A0A6C2YJ95_9BACT|nr:unnamed protein product [Tuwongella immobilis]VTR99008.1 unnamed protein product [Tuwongella immobilis]
MIHLIDEINQMLNLLLEKTLSDDLKWSNEFDDSEERLITELDQSKITIRVLRPLISPSVKDGPTIFRIEKPFLMDFAPGTPAHGIIFEILAHSTPHWKKRFERYQKDFANIRAILVS